MKIAIVSTELQWEIDRISEQAIARGHKIILVNPRNAPLLSLKKEQFDAAIFRVSQGAGSRFRRLAKYFIKHGVVCLDQDFFLPSKSRDKFEAAQLFRSQGLFMPKTLRFSFHRIAFLKKQFKKDVIIKPENGRRGRDIHKCRIQDLSHITSLLRRNEKYIIQDYVPLKKEFRVLMLHGKILGCYLKKTKHWKHNVSQGSIPLKYRIRAEIKDLARYVYKFLDKEFIGLDIAVTRDNHFFVIEGNRSPQFRGFMQAFPKKQVALKVIKTLERKVMIARKQSLETVESHF
jgi:RimK family alpha-L-glutamate ligase